jgi:SAM-dependent methyltransferase
MASTNRTFDVAIWCAPSDLTVAGECARNLARCQLRVKQVSLDPSCPRSNAIDNVLRSAARVNLAVVARSAVPAWLEEPAPFTASHLDPNTHTVLAPDVSAADAKQLERSLPGRVWDTRRAWYEHGTWRALGRHVLGAGISAETEIEPRFSLMPSNLRRATIESYDDIAEQFAEQWFDHPPRRELDLFLQKLRPKSCVLDAGCGPAHHARILSNAGHDVVAIDLSDGMLEQARKRVHSIRVMKMNIEALTFSVGSFDAIWCAAAILHVPREHIVTVFRGFWRVLKPGGVLGLNFQVGRSSELVQRGLDARFFEYYPDAGDVADLLGIAGFAVERAAYGETRRNTHELDITLKWSTLYARRGPASNLRHGLVAGENRLTELELGLAPREEVDLLDPR